MHYPNYMLQDLTGTLAAILLFAAILICPGYVIGYLLDIFDFKKRRPIVQVGIAAILSASLSPIMFFLVYRILSAGFALSLLLIFTIIFVNILIRTNWMRTFGKEISQSRNTRIGLAIASLWIVIGTLFLIDIQWHDRLYFNIVGYDYATRALVINAITRTGVPPINPSYYPGMPTQLTYLYYFWYVLCSLIDQVGGKLVDARMALMASAVWTGLILMAAVMFFTRLRNPGEEKEAVWRKAWLGVAFLLVSGLDLLPAIVYILFPKLLVGGYLEGDIEHWNEQITAWIGAITWTPHHIIGAIACITTWLLINYNWNVSLPRKAGLVTITGLTIASALGLSVWVLLVFVMFWGLLTITKLLRYRRISDLWLMLLPGLIAIVAALPFLIDLLRNTSQVAPDNQFPLSLSFRAFHPLNVLWVYAPTLDLSPFYLLALPLNYFMELGFFYVAGILWLGFFARTKSKVNPYAEQENLLLLVVLLLMSFVRSTAISNNDFGWRGWIFGQFILILWSVDIVQYLWSETAPPFVKFFGKLQAIRKIRSLLLILGTVGILTSLLDVVLLRAWPIFVDAGLAGFPRHLSPDNNLGRRTLAARAAFAFIDDNLPADVVIQFDPRFILDRPSGLYRTRTAAIAYHSLYGVPKSSFAPLIEGVGNIFDQNNTTWQMLDSACEQYHIDVLVLRDLDPIWANLNALKLARKPIYENGFFAVFKCNTQH